MSLHSVATVVLDADAFRFYRTALRSAADSGVPFLVGGAYALGAYTGIARHTKDLDLFTRPADAPRLLAALEAAGYRSETTFTHWLGKAFAGDDFIDVIFSSGNGLCPVDDAWFEHAVAATVLETPVHIVPAEEMIWQKAFIMERERFDGADVNHLLRARGKQLDWGRLVRRFGPHWRVLLGHLVFFGFVYPQHQDQVPAEVLRELTIQLLTDTQQPADSPLCRGPLLSREQYLIDTQTWGYGDARLPPSGSMTPEEIVHWTAGIDH